MVSLFLISAIAYYDGSHIKTLYANRNNNNYNLDNLANLSCFEEILKKLFTSLKMNDIIDNKVYTKNFLIKERERIFTLREIDSKKPNLELAKRLKMMSINVIF